MEWQEFYTIFWSTASKEFDLIHSEPPQAPSRSFQRSAALKWGKVEEIEGKEITEFPSFCKSVLKPGAYVILVIPFYLFSESYESLYRAGFQVMDYPYVFSKDSSTVPVRWTKKYPQNGKPFAIIATATGNHPDPFQPCFSGRFSHVNWSHHDNLSTMFNVSQPRSRLLKPNYRIPYNCDELFVKMLCECMNIFCPYNGFVLDPYSGTMTTVISSRDTGRICTALEINRDCFETDVGRLHKLLPKESSSILLDLVVKDYEDKKSCKSDDGPAKNEPC